MYHILAIALFVLMNGCEKKGSSSNDRSESDKETSETVSNRGKIVGGQNRGESFSTGGESASNQVGKKDSSDDEYEPDSNQLVGAHASEFFILGKDAEEPNCNNLISGKTIYLSAKAQFQYCDGKSWIVLDLRGQPGKDGAPGAQGPKGEPGISCNTANINGGATITCGNTISTLASPGNVIALSNGITGSVSSTVLTSGKFIYRDANNVNLCELTSTGCEIGNAVFENVYNSTNLNVIFIRPSEKIIFYQKNNCTGTPIGDKELYSARKSYATDYIHYLATYFDGERYFVADKDTFKSEVLYRSKRSMNPAYPDLPALCIDETKVLPFGYVLINFFLPSELKNAAFPANLHEIP